jgi:hypothetical protein
MSPPRQNTRRFNSPLGIGNPPPPGFQTVLNLLLAQRDAALGVTVPSQPIARWSSSSQPEILWELLAERRRAGIPPTLSQEQDAALEAAIAHIPPPTVADTIATMEEAAQASQGGQSPALTVVSDAFWEAIQLALPASGIPADFTTAPAFTEACQPSQSMGSSPMDISSDLPSPGLLTAPPPPPPQLGDDPNAPIILSSDSDVQVLSGAVNTRGQHVGSEAASPPLAEHEASSPLPASSMSGERPSDHFPSASVSFGDDAAHALELSSDSPASSFHPSQADSVPDMGPARRGGKMTSGRPTDQFEDASPAVLARARYLNVIPARDTKSMTPEREPSEVARAIPALQRLAAAPQIDKGVFNVEFMEAAQREAEAAFHGITDELNRVREGFSHYFLNDPLTILEDPPIPVESAHLRRMADIIGAVISGGPRTAAEGENDVWATLPTGDWFRLATFLTAAIVRGCIRTPGVGRKGAFDVEPCRDQSLHDSSLVRPHTQRDLLMVVSAQVLEELKDEGALLPQDSCDGLRATVWRAHEGQIWAWMEREVMSVYSRLSDMCLSDILDLLERKASVEEITDTMREEIAQETRGKFRGLIAAEKTKAYDAAVAEARADALREALATGAAEAVQKGKAYEKMILTRAEDEARTEGDRVYKSRLESLRTKMKRKAETEVEAEHAAVLTERRSALEENLLAMDFNARKDYIRTQAIQLGLLNDSATPVPSPPKHAKVGNAPMTTPKASSASSAAKTVSHLAPSSCPAAEEDDSTPRASTAPVDWSMSGPEDPLPSIDFEADTRSTAASRYAPGNAMEDDLPIPGAVLSLRDPDTGPIPLSASISPASAPTPVTAPSPAPTTAPPSEVKQLFDLIVSKMAPLEREVARIANIVDGKAGPTCPSPPNRSSPSNSRPNPSITRAAPPTTPSSGGKTPSSAPTPSPMGPRIDDDDESFPALRPASRGPSVSNGGGSRVSARAPAQVGSSSAPRRSAIGLSFAAVITETSMDQQAKAAGHARLARGVQKRNPSGKPKPGYSAAPLGFTDVVVIRDGGLDDREVEDAFRRRQPVDIAQAAQRALNAIVRSPPIILRGRWAESVEKTGNFVFRFAGDLSAQVIASYRDSLCSHFLAADSACVVPTSGWTWVQFRGVDITRVEGDSEVIHSSEDLMMALRANPCFNKVTFCSTLHWQGNPANFRSNTATVIMAILDPDNSACQRASSEGVCMFGRRIKFVRAGAAPSLVQCTRCHEIGHYYSSPKCQWTTSRCYRCGGPHDARDHDFECKNQHKVVGVCDCVPKCLLCKNSGHHAREKGCPARGDFVPPHLPRAALIEALPIVEDAHKSAAIPSTRPRARLAHRGRGGRGGKGKSRGPRIPLTTEAVEDICAHNEESLRAYCFCCPALRLDEFQILYTNPPEADTPPTLSAKGKSAQDVFGECILRKNKGPDFVHKAGPDVFHSEEELHEFLVRAACGASAHINYAEEEPSESMSWLANMPSDEEAGWNAAASNNTIRKEVQAAMVASSSTLPPPIPVTPVSLAATVVEADQAVSSWKDVRRNVTVHLPEGGVARQTNPDGSLVTLPSRKADRPAREGLQLDPRAGHSEHVMIINRQALHVGWSGPAHNQFAALQGPAAPPATADDPSEVDPNA